MIWQEWCLVISAVLLALEIGFQWGKERMLKLYLDLEKARGLELKQ